MVGQCRLKVGSWARDRLRRAPGTRPFELHQVVGLRRAQNRISSSQRPAISPLFAASLSPVRVARWMIRVWWWTWD